MEYTVARWNNYEYRSQEEADELLATWTNRYLDKADRNPDIPFQDIVFEAAGLEALLGITGLQGALLNRKHLRQQLEFQYPETD